MKLNLKNTRRLESSIDTEIENLMGMLDGYTVEKQNTQKAAIDVALDTINLVRDQVTKLTEIKYIIRQGIADFNEDNKINEYCIEIAKLHAELKLQQEIEGIALVSEDRMYNSNVPSKYKFGITTEIKQEYHKQTLVTQRKIQRLKDKCSGINSTGTIYIIDEHYKFLQDYGLLD